jgi:lipopolysaccharide export LptBFGC system permease protein LptF
MTTLIYILIAFFVCLIGYQLFLALSPKSLIEGMENEEETDVVSSTTTTTTTSEDPLGVQATSGGSTAQLTYTNYGDENDAGRKALDLSKVNADNIKYLKMKIDDMGTFNDQLDDFKHNFEQTKTDFRTQLDSQQDQITNLGKQAADATTAITSPEAQETLNDTEGLNASNDVANVEQEIDDEDENNDESETINF